MEILYRARNYKTYIWEQFRAKISLLSMRNHCWIFSDFPDFHRFKIQKNPLFPPRIDVS